MTAISSVDLEWGATGARHLAERSDVLVLVDVLSFTTSLTVAVARGASVWPHTGKEGVEDLTEAIGARLVRGRSASSGPTLSPVSLLATTPDDRLVMPSPNGSAIAHAAVAASVPVVAACLRNASAVAAFAAQHARVGIVAAGERWADGTLRFAYEDLVGAGAVVSALLGEAVRTEDRSGVRLSPEARAARAAFADLAPLHECYSGVELVERGFGADVDLAAEDDVEPVVPLMTSGRFAAAR